LLTLVASICGVTAVASTVAGAGPIDEAHVGVVVGEHRSRRSHRVRRRDTDPVRRQARRRSRCLAHAARPRPFRATAHRTETPFGPPVHRGPPVA
jgi:hypothetical protein